MRIAALAVTSVLLVLGGAGCKKDADDLSGVKATSLPTKVTNKDGSAAEGAGTQQVKLGPGAGDAASRMGSKGGG
jgi:hypothetical protein